MANSIFKASALILISSFIVYFLKEHLSKSWPCTVAITLYWQELQAAGTEEYYVIHGSGGAAVGLLCQASVLFKKNIPVLQAVQLVSFLSLYPGRFPQSWCEQSEKPKLSAPEEQSQLLPQLCKGTWQKASCATRQCPAFKDR